MPPQKNVTRACFFLHQSLYIPFFLCTFAIETFAIETFAIETFAIETSNETSNHPILNKYYLTIK